VTSGSGDLRAFYDRIAPVFDTLVAEDRTEVDAILDRLPKVAGGALDIGIGTGRFALPMARRGWSVIGIDLSPGMLAQARKAAEEAGVADRIDLREGDATAIDALPEGPFEVILAIGVLFHVTSPESRTAFIEALARRLAPGGRLLIDTESDASGGWAAERPTRTLTVPDGDALTLTVHSARETGTQAQRAEVSLTGLDAGTEARFVVDSSWLPRAAFEALLTGAGLVIVGTWADWGADGGAGLLVAATRPVDRAAAP
jgi:SAM-dependent methyltransferase